MKKIAKILITAFVLAIAAPVTFAQVSVGIGISARIAPPELPVYVQPACPHDGYLWQPGYWAYDPQDGYYWVPGVWVAPPAVDVLWTPPYWGYDGGVYAFHAGFWGPEVGFYGGVNYGFGYWGHGFYGGRWDRGHFRYNTAVFNINTRIVHNYYSDRAVSRYRSYNRMAYNGPGGVNARPRAEELAAMKHRRFEATAEQRRQRDFAHQNRAQFAKVNHGRPAATAMDRIGGHAYSNQGHAANVKRADMAANRAATRAAADRAHADRVASRPNSTAAERSRANRAASRAGNNATTTRERSNVAAARASKAGANRNRQVERRQEQQQRQARAREQRSQQRQQVQQQRQARAQEQHTQRRQQVQQQRQAHAQQQRQQVQQQRQQQRQAQRQSAPRGGERPHHRQ